MPERPRFAQAEPLPEASPCSEREDPSPGPPECRPNDSASFVALLWKLSDAYASIESDNRRLLNALQAAKGLPPTEALSRSPEGSAEQGSPRTPREPTKQQQQQQLQLTTPGQQQQQATASVSPALESYPVYGSEHRSEEAEASRLTLCTAFTSRTFETGWVPGRTQSEYERDAVNKDHELRRKYVKIAERSKTKNRSMFTEIDMMIAERQVVSPRKRRSKMMTCEDAMGAMNIAVGRVDEDDVLSFEAFRDLISREDLEDTVDPEVLDFALIARHAFEREDLTKMVAKFSHVGTGELKLAETSLINWSLFMDPVSFLLIFSNSVVLAVSTDVDPDWTGWDYIELGFTSFFVCELTIKMCVNGVCNFFLGSDRGWNFADFVFVAFAVIDAMLVHVAQVGESDFQMFTLMRLVRLCRITRLVRLLRFKVFKELLLMIQGIVAGLRTLFWAIILLTSVIFCLGMLMRQTIGRWCEKGEISELCNQEHLALYGNKLLGTVPRACFTVFRCFTEGCASSDGTPLLVHIYENNWYGALVVVIYMLIFLAITFGLFNLIMAVFVENTMESAKLDERKRRQMRHRESLIIARKLQRIVVRFSQPTLGDGAAISHSGGRLGDGRSSISLFWRKPREEGEAAALGVVGGADMNVQITRDMFRDAVSDPSMEALLEDLEVNVSDPMTLFDTLDADDSGSLDVSELIQGIIKLRGTADKSDVIASLLSIRAMQKSLRKFEFKVLQSQKRMEAKLAVLEQHARCWQAPSPPQVDFC